MKIIVFLSIALFSVLYSPAPGELVVTVTNLTPAGGDLYIAIYNNEESYMHPDLAFMRKIVPVDSETKNVVFSDIPPGEYAISLFQDINGNGELDKKGAGIPKEPFGFSNDARGKVGPAKYKDAKFRFSNKLDMQIKLVNNVDR